MYINIHMILKCRLSQEVARLYLFLALLFFIEACAPKIEIFKASPSRLCLGDSTTISWKIGGDKRGILSAAPLQDLSTSTITLPVASEGSKKFAPQHSTRFRIRSQKKERVFQEIDVLVFDAQGKKDFGGVTQPDSTNPNISLAVFSPDLKNWPDQLRVNTVSSPFQRKLTVIHEGRQITLPSDGTPSDELRGAKVSGEWILKTELLPNEKGENPSNRPPGRLGITISFFCKTGGE